MRDSTPLNFNRHLGRPFTMHLERINTSRLLPIEAPPRNGEITKAIYIYMYMFMQLDVHIMINLMQVALIRSQEPFLKKEGNHSFKANFMYLISCNHKTSCDSSTCADKNLFPVTEWLNFPTKGPCTLLLLDSTSTCNAPQWCAATCATPQNSRTTWSPTPNIVVNSTSLTTVHVDVA